MRAAFIVALLLASGCVGSTATPATHGKAYIVKGNILSSSMYYCDAAEGAPACWEVAEIPTEQPE